MEQLLKKILKEFLRTSLKYTQSNPYGILRNRWRMLKKILKEIFTILADIHKLILDKLVLDMSLVPMQQVDRHKSYRMGAYGVSFTGRFQELQND